MVLERIGCGKEGGSEGDKILDKLVNCRETLGGEKTMVQMNCAEKLYFTSAIIVRVMVGFVNESERSNKELLQIAAVSNEWLF